MNEFEKLFDLKKELERIIENLEGREVCYKGCYGTIMYVHIDGSATVYLENENREGREQELTWSEICKNMEF